MQANGNAGPIARTSSDNAVCANEICETCWTATALDMFQLPAHTDTKTENEFDLTGISYVQLSRVIETGSNYHILLPSGVRRPRQHQTLLWSPIVSTPAAISCEIQDISIVLSSTRFYCRNTTLLFQVSTVDLTCVICGTNILCQCVPDKEEGRTPLSRHVTIIRI